MGHPPRGSLGAVPDLVSGEQQDGHSLKPVRGAHQGVCTAGMAVVFRVQGARGRGSDDTRGGRCAAPDRQREPPLTSHCLTLKKKVDLQH